MNYKKHSVAHNLLYKYVGSGNGVHFTVPDVSMFGMLKISAKGHPDAYAYEYFGSKCTYAQLLERIERVSQSYYHLGVRKGDIVMILMANTPEAVISIYALNRIGAVANIVHPLSGQDEIKNYINSSDSEYVLCMDACLNKVKNIIDDTCLKTVIVASAGDSMTQPMKSIYALSNKNKKEFPKNDGRYISWKEFSEKRDMRATEFVPDTEENKKVAVILHSGGTTGTPKDIMLSNYGFNAFGMQAIITLSDVSVGDKILAILPIFHGFGLGVCIHVSFCFGACSVLIPLFDSKKFGNILKKYKPTMLFGVPTLYDALINSQGAEKIDLSFLKYVVSGGDSLSKPLENKVNEFLRNHKSKVRICEGYGMTEGLAALSLSVNEGYKSGTIGKPLIGNEMCVVEPGTTRALPPNTDGELCVSGPTVMLGYRNNDVETANTLKRHNDGKIWLHTGDIASIDQEGFVSYKLRLKRMIISSGYNVYPTQVEKVIEDIPCVLKCTVVAMPHPYKKEVPKAYVVLKKDCIADENLLQKIKAHCEKNLSRHSVPYKYEVVEELPKTAYGKVDIRKLQNEA
jgi:long-chain acyl-CoA synthetase